MTKPSNRNAKQLTTSVLDYLVRYERYAMLHNDRRTVNHFQDCWCVVFTQFYGGYSVPHLHKAELHIVQGPVVPAAKPQWHVQKYSRPACKVVAQVMEQVRLSKRHAPCTVTYDVLKCGHHVEATHNEDGTNTHKWRYCNECPPKQQAPSDSRGLDSRAA